MKLLARILVIPIFCLSFGIMSSCDDDDDDDNGSPNITYKTVLTGASETPPNASTATGDATLTYNDDTNIFTLKVNYTGIDVTDAHVHKGAVGVAGPPVFPLPVSDSPMNYTSRALTEAEENDLKAGMYYVNLHSETYPDGEIRGQILKEGSGGPY